jgi:hypothetical protein
MASVRHIALGFGVLAAGLASSGAVSTETPRAAAFIIADQDGYGTGECLAKPSSCGRIIADSFCQSKGFRSHALYRPAEADDVTGSLNSTVRPMARDPQAFVIVCK